MIQQKLIDHKPEPSPTAKALPKASLKEALPRVLVVENDLRWRRDHKKNLTRWGYRTFVAQGQGPSLLQDAINKVKKHRCDIAIISKELIDVSSPANHSGLDLVPKLKPAEAIIVSGHADFPAARKALLEKGAKHFVGKEEGPRLLREVVEEILQSICAAKNEIEIEWAPGLSAETILSCLFPQATDAIPADQVADILGQLFPNAKRLQLQTLHGFDDLPQSGTPLHSVVLKVYIDDLVEPEIVKIAPPEDIQKQSERYKRYVERRLSGSYYTSLKDEACLWDIGAARYDFLGAPNQSMITWAQLYQSTESINDLVKPLQFFFNELWSDYYQKANSKYYYTLFDCYCGVWGESWANRLHNSYRDKYLKIPTLNLKALHPVRWLLDKSASDGAPQTRLAVTHGDLHGGNLFVHDGHAWVIDFERTGPGPIYQDFAELEVNILIQLTDYEELATFHELAMILINVNRANEIQAASLTASLTASRTASRTPSLTNQEAHKALSVIKKLRQLAEEKITKFDMQEYLWCLLFDSVFLVSLPALKSKRRQAQRERALLLGGLICERLERAQAKQTISKQAISRYERLEKAQAKQTISKQAISKYRRTLARYTPQMFPRECREAAYSLGCLFYDAERFAEAREAFEVGHEAIQGVWTEVLSGEEKGRLGVQNADLYGRLVHCCVLLGDDEAAFEYGVAGKRRKVLDSLASEGFDLFTAVENNPTVAKDPKWGQYRQLLEEINRLRATLRSQMGMPPRPALTHSMQKKRHDQLQALVAQQNTLWDQLALNYPTLTATQQTPRFTLQQAHQLAEDLSGGARG